MRVRLAVAALVNSVFINVQAIMAAEALQMNATPALLTL